MIFFLFLLHVINLHQINTSSVVSMFPKNMNLKCNIQGTVKPRVSNRSDNNDFWKICNLSKAKDLHLSNYFY